MKILKNTRVLGAVGVVSILIGLFATYINVEIFYYAYDYNLIDYFEGKLIFLLTILTLVFIFKDYLKKYVPEIFDSPIGKKIDDINNPIVLLIPAGLIAVLVIFMGTQFDYNSDYATYGLGFYTVWAGIIALVAHSFMFKLENMPNNYNSMDTGIQNNYYQNINNGGMNQGMQVNYNQNTFQNANNQNTGSNSGPSLNNYKICNKCLTKCDAQNAYCYKCGEKL